MAMSAVAVVRPTPGTVCTNVASGICVRVIFITIL